MDSVIKVENLNFYYGNFLALKDINMEIFKNNITAFIGPSGCGKSTFLRTLNRMNDFIENTKVEGKILFQGQDIYSGDIDPVELRRRIGMVFQKPNPFPKTIYE
ncbi:MAG: ATP-binding cassette domain-containing protein, partial [Caloramator sp.]|nr:ATP-binding cassette domain-containing protein [Caloramator sp.]